LDGYIYRTEKQFDESWKKWTVRILFYLVSFGTCVSIALAKPSCFLVVLEYFTSMALNLENGVFIALMAMISMRQKPDIPVPLANYWFSIAGVTSLFFSGAVIYDLVVFLEAIISGRNLC
jgi:hypothetical protein